MISIYCNSNKLVNRMMGANVLRSAVLMSRRKTTQSQLMKNHYNNNNNMQSMRSFSYKFDPPKSSKVSLGVGLGLATGILIGGFGIHVDVSPVDNSLGISVGPPRVRNELYQLGYQQAVNDHNHLDFLAYNTAGAVLTQKAPGIAAERYLVSAINAINVRCLDDRNSDTTGLQQFLKTMATVLPQLKRLVLVKGDDDDEGKVYELLKDDGMDSCLVKGPLQLLSQDRDGSAYLTEDSSYEGAQTITVKRDDVYSRENSPVECHGLVGDKSYLNGKLGTINGSDSKEGRNFLISFEDSSGTAWVPRQNIRGVVNLPLFREFDPYPMVPPCTPVVCQGLVSDHEKHLNNKRGTVLGDVDANYTTTVVFEDENIPDTKVHLKNLFLSSLAPAHVKAKISGGDKFLGGRKRERREALRGKG